MFRLMGPFAIAIAIAIAIANASIAWADCLSSLVEFPHAARPHPAAVFSASRTGHAGLFVDASASMRGFGRPGGAQTNNIAQSVFASMYSELPAILKEIDSEVSYFRVGKWVDPITSSMLTLASRPAFYCPALSPSDRLRLRKDELEYYDSRCVEARKRNDFQAESRIEKAIDMIAATSEPNQQFDVAVIA